MEKTLDSIGYADQLSAYMEFIKVPSAENAYLFVLTCHKYISILASKWHQRGMTRRRKINEIITEMFLILLEDFCSKKAVVPKAAMAYIDVKLKRLVKGNGRYNSFLDLDFVPASKVLKKGEFKLERLYMTEEIVSLIRRNLFEKYSKKDGLVPFLFIHVYPKIRWISELMALKDNTLANARYEADAKRISRLNSSLRSQFDSLGSGDWHEIADWSFRERRHLAWKIISISPKEIESNALEDLARLEKWRDNFVPSSPDNLDNLKSAERVYSSMNSCYSEPSLVQQVAEEAEIWGEPQDIISMLIGDFVIKESQVGEIAEDYKVARDKIFAVEKDEEFLEVASELKNWFGGLLGRHMKNLNKNNGDWHY